MTTVHPDVLERLGLPVRPSNPVMRFQTANGERQDSVTVLEKVWMAGLGVEGVSVASCTSCATEGSVGLLGLNVSGQFQVTLDPARRVIVLVPNTATPDRQIDVSPWLELEGHFRSWGDGRVDLDVTLENTAERAIQDVNLAIACGDDEFTSGMSSIPSGESRRERVGLPRFSDCSDGRISLASARW